MHSSELKCKQTWLYSGLHMNILGLHTALRLRYCHTNTREPRFLLNMRTAQYVVTFAVYNNTTLVETQTHRLHCRPATTQLHIHADVHAERRARAMIEAKQPVAVRHSWTGRISRPQQASVQQSSSDVAMFSHIGTDLGYHYSMTTDPENHDPGSLNLCYSMTIR